MNLPEYINKITQLQQAGYYTKDTLPNLGYGMLDVCNQLAPLPADMWKPARLIPASPSSVEKMATCPRQFDAAYVGHDVQKIEFKQHLAVIRGEVLHTACETWLKGDTNGIRDFWMHVKNHILARSKTERECPFEFGEMRYDIPAIEWLGAELDKLLAFSNKLVVKLVLEQSVGWNDQRPDGAWKTRKVGAKSDIIIPMSKNHWLYIDLKTGKVYDKPFQLELTAFIQFSLHPELTRFTTQYLYADQQTKVVYEYHRDKPYAIKHNPEGLMVQPLEYPQLMPNYWRNQATRSFPPQKSGLCGGWCQVTGCSFNGEYGK